MADVEEDSQRTYTAIGHFIFEFSQLEAALKYHISEACRIRADHYEALLSHDFAMLCTIARTVLVNHEDSEGKILQDIINRCRRMNDVRVRVVHGLWVPFKDGGTLVHTSRSLKTYLNADQARQLEEDALETNQLRNRFEWYAVGSIAWDTKKPLTSL
jgi:hypothetical protein